MKKITEQLQWRYATKRFDAAKKIPSAEWQALLDAMMLTPSSYGLQPYKVVIVENRELRTQLRACSYNQSQVEDASHFVVFTAATKITEQDINQYIERIVRIRGTPENVLQDFKKVMSDDLLKRREVPEIQVWAQKQTYIVMGMLLTAAAMLSIDACPMEGIEPAKYDELLGLRNSGYATVSAVALGYRHDDDAFGRMKKVRKTAEELFLSV